MTYGVNGSEFTQQPSSGRWMPQTSVGVSGDGHPIYPAVWSFQLTWNVIAPAQFEEIYNAYKSAALTGTVVMQLPDLDAATYTFKNYSGCTLQKPEVGQYFTEHLTDVSLFVLNIMP